MKRCRAGHVQARHRAPVHAAQLGSVSPEIASTPEHGNASDLITVLRDKAPRAAMAIAAGQAARPVIGWARKKISERATYTVKVPGSDDIYDDLHEYVLALLPPGEQRALVAWSSRRGELSSPDSGGREQEPSLRLRYDGSREQGVRIAGHRVRVSVADGQGGDAESRWKPPEIIFTAPSAAARDAVLTEIRGVLRASRAAKRKPAFRMLGKWGDWERLDDLPQRDLDSVILPPGQAGRLTADVGRFLAAEQEYARRCIPWHRGHLYEGPPGTGKTSVARAVASHFSMDVWFLPLADVKKDGDLLRMASRIAPRSMLLLEDVDVFHAATARDDNADQVTLSGLLNTLDGIATPHGLLTVLTTNTPEVIDAAVIRPGRIDLVEHFGLADEDQAARIVSRYYGVELARNASAPAGAFAPLAPSEVVEICKRNNRIEGAVHDIWARAVTAAAA